MDTMIWSCILLITAGITVGGLIFIRHMKSAVLRRGVFLAATAFILVPAIWLSVRFPLNAGVILLHLTGFLIGAMIVDAIIDLIEKKKSEKKEKEPRAKRLSRIATAAMIGCLIYLIAGYVNAGWIRRTTYVVNTEKTIAGGHLRIAQLSDVHLGTTMDSEEFEDLLVKISNENADILAVTGDLIDENTSREEMLRCCAAFSAKCSVPKIFYIAGNHDVYEDMAFTEEELFEALKANGVTVLCDDVALMPEGYYVVGRKDASENRKSMAELLEDVDPTKYIIILDHQPNDFDRESQFGTDLVLTGHMHGGYLFPMRLVAPLLTGFFGDSDRIAGREIRGNSHFIVSSGAGTWGCSFKTGAISEYVIIDVSSSANVSDVDPTRSNLDELTDEDFERHEYRVLNETTDQYIYTFKNKSGKTVGIEGRLTLFSAGGDEYESLWDEIDILAPGEESILVFDLSNYDDEYQVEFKADYNTFPFENPVISDLKVEMITNPNVTKEKLSAIIKNTGTSYAENVNMYVVYFSSGTAVGCEKKYLQRLKPNASVAVAFQTENAYDEARYYLTGYSSVNLPRETDPVSKEDFAVRQYNFTNEGRELYFLAIKNNGDKTAKVNGIIIGGDERGYMIVAKGSNDKDNVLRPGDEALLRFDLPADVGVTSVGYDLSFDTELAPQENLGQGELDVTKKIDGNMATVTVTNRSYSWPMRFSMTVLFYDASGNVVWADEADIVDLRGVDIDYDPYVAGNTLSGGAAIIRQFYSPVPFDSVEVFCDSTTWMMVVSKVSPTPVTVRDDAFETSGHLIQTEDRAEYICLVKNNSDTTVAVSGSAIALDASGKVLAWLGDEKLTLPSAGDYVIDLSDISGGATTITDLLESIGFVGTVIDAHNERRVAALHPGETGVLWFAFSDLNVSEIDRIVCPLMYDTKAKDNPVNTDIHAEVVMKEGTTLTIKAVNESAYECQRGVLYALYFDQDHKLIAYDQKNLATNTNKIYRTGDVVGEYFGDLSAGSLTTLRLECPEEFDSVEFYASSSSVAYGNEQYRCASEGDFTVREYRGAQGSMYALAIQNNMDRSVGVNALVTAYDADGKAIGVDSSTLSVIGSGEEYVMCFDLRTEGAIDHIAYELRYAESTTAQDTKKELTIEETTRPDGVEVSVTNKGVMRLNFVYATVLFLDSDGHVVYCAEESFKNELAKYYEPGEAQTCFFECPVAFDKALTFINCYKVSGS
ncbi:MAG: metallophosphoesterase [Lachnospiraceae bacterium]|nr:metallophosphoesterase [Lachnospiraceae bacterium]